MVLSCESHVLSAQAHCHNEKWCRKKKRKERRHVCPGSAVRESADMMLCCLLLQVQAGGDPSASGAGCGGVLDCGIHRGAHAHVRLEQPEASPAKWLHQLRPHHHLPI